MKHIPLFQAKKAVHLNGDDYYHYLMNKIENAKKSILSTMFIVSVLNPSETGKMKELLDKLVYAHWEGLDVRLIIGSARPGIIKFVNTVSLKYLEKKKLPVKLYDYPYDTSVHSKYVIIDDEIIVLGSANWTDNAMFRNKEDSIAVYSEDSAQKLREEFEKVWSFGLEVKDENK
jgi:phosphatidylserine/phosphatidylglycerophosphate/cardiolipin synthase-like enzyme